MKQYSPAARAKAHATEHSKFTMLRGLLVCPACFLIRDLTPPGFVRTLSRCPRTFVIIDEPPAGSRATDVRVEFNTVGK